MPDSDETLKGHLKGQRGDITNEDVSKALKAAATVLKFPTTKGIPIDRIDTHSLRSGGANALSLSGYSDTQIQKMGRWQGANVQEHEKEIRLCKYCGQHIQHHH